MPLPSPRDTNEPAHSIVAGATGEQESDSKSVTDSPATALRRTRGAKGGRTRAANLEPKERRAIAKKAAAARWSSRAK
jgi:hypothetical protein